MRSRKGSPRPTWRLAMDTTSRRLASVSLLLASMSPRSMRLASDTSSAAVSSGTLPISVRYMRTGSVLGVLIDRSSAGASSSPAASGASAAGGLVAFEELDALIGEQHEDVLELVGRKLDVLQRARRCGRWSDSPVRGPRRPVRVLRRSAPQVPPPQKSQAHQSLSSSCSSREAPRATDGTRSIPHRLPRRLRCHHGKPVRSRPGILKPTKGPTRAHARRRRPPSL